MNVYLFNCRVLQAAGQMKSNYEGYFSIYTVFDPDELICFDAMFFTMADENESDGASTQCTYFEETPQLLDPDLDQDILLDFNEMISSNDFSEAILPDEMATKIKFDAMDFGQQLVTN